VTSITTHESRRPQDGPPQRIARVSFGLVILLLIQYILGLSYNLYGKMPTANKKVGIFSSGLLAVHVILGTLLIVIAIYLVVITIKATIRLALITSVIGLLSLLGAWVTGSAFTQKGGDGYSMAMGVLTAAAMLCYLLNVRVFARQVRNGHR
jgi:hypothetical protein